jgi:hypothetical protein
MFRSWNRPEPRLTEDVLNEIRSICHSQQVSLLALPKSLRRDTGTDCGCDVSPEQNTTIG